MDTEVLVKHYAFDVDGTLDCSMGPVPVRTLGLIDACGDRVSIVSPSGMGTHLKFARFVTGLTRETNLREAKTHFPTAS